MTADLTAEGLAALLRERLCRPLPHPREVLLCSQDVSEVLTGLTQPPADPSPAAIGLALLTGIDVVVAGDSAPGCWRLIQHDNCAVDTEKLRVSHALCNVVAEGRLA